MFHRTSKPCNVYDCHLSRVAVCQLGCLSAVLAAQSQMAQLTEGWGAAPDWGQLPTTPVPPAPSLPGVETSWPAEPDWGAADAGDESAPPPPAESSDLPGQMNGHTETAEPGAPPAVGSRCIALFQYEVRETASDLINFKCCC